MSTTNLAATVVCRTNCCCTPKMDLQFHARGTNAGSLFFFNCTVHPVLHSLHFSSHTSISKMGGLSVLAASAVVVSFASAFRVDFNSGERCTGTVVGRCIGSTGRGCHSAFTRINSSESVPAPGGSFDVVIRPQANDTRSGVAFFGQPDCEVLIGFSNVPLCTGVRAWPSFKVITIDEADDQLTNLDPAPILPIPSNPTAAVGRGDRFAVPSGMSEDVTGTSRIPGPSSTTVASTSSETSTAIGGVVCSTFYLC